MKLSSEFLRECIEERLESAVRYGVRRAYKHSEAHPPTDAQIDEICKAVTSVIYEVIEWEDSE